MGLFPGASCWFARVTDSTTGRVSRTLVTVFVSVIIAAQKASRVWLKLTHAQTEKFDALDCTNSTVGETRVGSCAIGYELATVLERSRVSARTRALPA